MTRRGVLTLLLGLLTYAVAWLFGAKALYPAAAGLVLAPLAARTWVRARRGADRAAQRPAAGSAAAARTLLEGEDVWVTLEARPRSRVPPPAIVVTEQLARLGERETPLRRVGRDPPRHVRARAGAARALRRRAGAGDDRRPVRARARRGRARRRRRAARLPAARRARPALLRERRARAGRQAAAAAPPVRLRPPLRARVRAGRVAAEGALAHDRAARPADGQGARGRAARRDRGRCSTRTRRRSAARASTSRCAPPARSCARTRTRPPRRPRGQLGVAAERARLLARRRLARRARAARGRASRTGRARWSSCSRARAGPASRALETVVVTARLSGALATKLVQRALAGAGRQRRLDRRAELRRPADARRAGAAAAAGGRRRGRGRPARRLARRGARRRAARRGARMARTAAVYSLPGALIALVWLRLEEPARRARTWLWVVLLALAPALAPTLWLRLALVVPAALVGAVGRARHARAGRPAAGSSSPVAERFDDGFFDYYDVTRPVQRARAAADARRPRARDLRLLPRARASSSPRAARCRPCWRCSPARAGRRRSTRRRASPSAR